MEASHTRRRQRQRERSMDSRVIEAENALEAVRRTLLEGGSCSVEAEGWRRVVVHDPAIDAPLRRWPWPFFLFSPHNVRLQIYEGALRVTTVTFGKKQIGEAIENFLRGVSAKTKVIITRERPLKSGRG
ncbi:MAG TPA: hypothetical protein VMJ70_08065 [Candidatus Sulfotelmatobacter sp.]|nr:hypothetical protein [Candidatus Sulfotelmatobacter sp.]